MRNNLEIFIVTYNRLEHLQKTLNQIFAESSPIKDFQITILDNCSDDGTSELIQKYVLKYPHLKHIRHQKNIGGNANIARAFEIAQKKYVWVLCDDDEYNWDNWREIEQAVRNDEDAIFVCECSDEKRTDITWIFKALSFVPSCIYKTEFITSNTLINAYANILYLFPHLAVAASFINKKKEFYIVKKPIVKMLENPNASYTRGCDDEEFIYPKSQKMSWLVGYLNSINLIEDKSIRKTARKDICLEGKSFIDTIKRYIKYAIKNNKVSPSNFADIFFSLNGLQKSKVVLHFPELISLFIVKSIFKKGKTRLKSNKILAFCNDTPGEPSQGLFDEFLQYGIETVSGKEALKLIQKKEICPEDVFFIQEILAKSADKLSKLGAKPFLLTSGEVAIYAPLLYDNLENVANRFQHRMLFRGSFDRFGGINPHNHILYFPTGSNTGVFNQIVPWNERKNIVMVVANKFCRLKFPTTINPKAFIRKLKTFLSPSYRESVKNNFQTKRLEAIEYWGALGEMDLYGGGRKNKRDMPLNLWQRLKSIIPKIYKGRCEDKIAVISNYKFAIAFENIAYPGYVTEKIIDCFVAGVIPIYLGAPDIQEFIPKNCFIDARDFSNFEELNNYLQTIDEKQAIEIIENGRNFLQTEEGQKYSCRYFVKKISELFHKEIHHEYSNFVPQKEVFK